MASKLKILIVEDSSIILERVNSLLNEMDCISEVFSSENGIRAVEMVEECNPDLVLLDINLPGKSGISILREIKSRLSTKVIMLTNYSDNYYRTLCHEIGADHFLDKTTEFEQIPELIKRLCAKAS